MVVTLVIRIIAMGVSEWPRKREPESLAACVAGIIFSLAWAGIVLWVGK